MVRRQSEVVSGKKVEKVKYGAKTLRCITSGLGPSNKTRAPKIKSYYIGNPALPPISCPMGIRVTPY